MKRYLAFVAVAALFAGVTFGLHPKAASPAVDEQEVNARIDARLHAVMARLLTAHAQKGSLALR